MSKEFDTQIKLLEEQIDEALEEGMDLYFFACQDSARLEFICRENLEEFVCNKFNMHKTYMPTVAAQPKVEIPSTAASYITKKGKQ